MPSRWLRRRHCHRTPPHRPQLILIAFVAATTLLLQGFTLPSVIRMAKVSPDDPERLRGEYSLLVTELQGAASEALADPAVLGAVGDSIPEVVIDLVRGQHRRPGQI